MYAQTNHATAAAPHSSGFQANLMTTRSEGQSPLHPVGVRGRTRHNENGAVPNPEPMQCLTVAHVADANDPAAHVAGSPCNGLPGTFFDIPDAAAAAACVHHC